MTYLLAISVCAFGGVAFGPILLSRISYGGEFPWAAAILAFIVGAVVAFLGPRLVIYGAMALPVLALRRERARAIAADDSGTRVQLTAAARALPDDDRVICQVSCYLDLKESGRYFEWYCSAEHFIVENDDGRWLVDGQYLRMKIRSVRTQECEVRDGDQIEISGMLRERTADVARTIPAMAAGVYRQAREREIYGTPERPVLITRLTP